ncbi:MAG TPA: ChaB family protein [Candidatus Babeliales bacterium]|nr:ChaB family protein [Candidatus Babeliales bacterium]
MPYQTNSDLPSTITNNLPEHAQTIFRKAFNHALETYGTEEQAFKVAWAAVKKIYIKNAQGIWVAK